jgi:hypothetical protein
MTGGKGNCRLLFVPVEIRPDVGAAHPASLTRKPGLKIRQPNLIRPSVATDRHGMAAPEIAAIDQKTTNA